MSEPTLYSVLSSQDRPAVRLGWISSATGITYCGICLGSAVRPRLGEVCKKCGACVVGVFDASDGWDTIRQAWRRAKPVLDSYAIDGAVESLDGMALLGSKQLPRLRRLA